MSLAPFTPRTDRVLADLEAESEGFHAASSGDLLLLCVSDAPQERWCAMPAAEIDEAGAITHVLTRDGRKAAVADLNQREAAVVIEIARYRNIPALIDLCWVEFPDLAAARDAFKAVFWRWPAS